MVSEKEIEVFKRELQELLDNYGLELTVDLDVNGGLFGWTDTRVVAIEKKHPWTEIPLTEYK